VSPHPNRSGNREAVGANPTPADLVAFREQHDLTQAEAAKLALSSLRSWANWESGERRMHPAIWQWVLHTARQR